MSFSSNLALWLGSAPNALQSGRVDCYVGANNDKTGYSLTAGSYSVRASSTQLGTIVLASGVDTTKTGAISSVTTTRANVQFGGFSTDNASANDTQFTRITLTNATTVTATRVSNTASNVTIEYNVLELF